MDIKGSFESLNAEYYEHLESENILQFKTLLGRNRNGFNSNHTDFL